MSSSGEWIGVAEDAVVRPAWTISQVHAGLDAALANAGMRQLWVTFPCMAVSQTDACFG